MKLAVVACLALGLSGCAVVMAGLAYDPNTGEDAQCQSYGAQPGTDAYVQCRTTLASARRARDAAASSSSSYLPGAVGSTLGGSPVATICFKTSESVSGFNRICNYNCTGSGASMTVAASQTCPTNINR